MDTTGIYLDTETTTNKDTPERPLEVIELAWHSFVPTSETARFFRKLYKPTMNPTYGATAVHHILPEELLDCAPSALAPLDLPPARYWIGHNIDFDWKALGSPPNVKRICTLALSRSLWPQSDAHNLSAMMYFLFGANAKTREALRSAHSATADCLFVQQILAEVTLVTGISDLEGLWGLSEDARVPRVWTFGKFKDQPISTADRGYASWYARQEDTDPYVLIALRREGLLR